MREDSRVSADADLLDFETVETENLKSWGFYENRSHCFDCECALGALIARFSDSMHAELTIKIQQFEFLHCFFSRNSAPVW